MTAQVMQALLGEWTRVAEVRPARWPLSTLVIGDATGAEFAHVTADLRARTDARFVASLIEAIEYLSDESQRGAAWSPDCFILLERRPGELCRKSYDRLRAIAPLSRAVCVLGSWCEGEFRSGQPWPAAVRMYWHQFSSWFERELSIIHRGGCSSLLLPITATEEERLLQNGAVDADKPESAPVVLRVAIQADRREMAELLAEICHGCGQQTIRLSPDNSSADDFAVAVWDLPTAAPQEIAAFAAAAAQYKNVRWIVLAGFIRPGVHALLLQHGASHVLSKPLVIESLQAAIANTPWRRADGQRLLFF